MTTKYLNNKICTFKIILWWRFPPKKNLLGRFSSRPPTPPPLQKTQILFLLSSCRLSMIYPRTQKLHSLAKCTKIAIANGPSLGIARATSSQLKRAPHKGNGRPVSETDGPIRRTEGTVTRTRTIEIPQTLSTSYA